MAGRILKEDIEALRQQADIVAVVGDHTTLKRAGRSFKGLCPFHTERTPSFTVSPTSNVFHCFGCGASGDLYDFLMRIEGLDFPEAVEAVARRVGYQLRYEELSARDRRAIGERTRLIGILAEAAAFYTAQLYAEAGQVARDYLRSRGFGRADAERFDLGFAPTQWDALSRALTAKGLPAADLIATGLAVRTDRGGLRDRFRGRLLFPVHDPSGDVVGFGGRILDALDYGDFDPPKYLNSPETPLYRKTRVLYGVPQARAEIVRAGQVLVCEGYTDVMALHQAGVANAVATCGTAVTVEHLTMIARYAPQVVLAFDGDAAGVKAAERAWEAARQVGAAGRGAPGAGGAGAGGSGAGGSGAGRTSARGDTGGLDLRVLVLPAGSDPADLVAEVGAEGVRAALDAATPVVPFVIRHRLADADLDSEGGRTAALREVVDILGREPDLDLRREWARTEVAAGIGVAYDFVARTAARLGIDLDRHEGVAVTGAAAGGGAPEQPGRGAASRDDPGARPDRARARRERAVLRLALQAPELLPDEWFELEVADLTHPTAQAVFETLTAAGGAGVPLAAVLEAAADDDLRGTIRELALEEETEPVDAELAAWRVRSLLADRLRGEETALRARLSTLHHRTDRDELLAVQRQLMALERRRRELTTVGD